MPAVGETGRTPGAAVRTVLGRAAGEMRVAALRRDQLPRSVVGILACRPATAFRRAHQLPESGCLPPAVNLRTRLPRTVLCKVSWPQMQKLNSLFLASVAVMALVPPASQNALCA